MAYITKTLPRFVTFALSLLLLVVSHGARANNTFKVVYRFPGGSYGAYPYSGVIADASGNLYGTTYEGGGTGCYDRGGCGTVFKLRPDGTEKVLHAFEGGSSDGAYPAADLIMDTSGNLYGTTTAGGTTACDGTYGCGAIFQITSKGTETVLYIFAAGSDGAIPQGPLVRDAKGNLYGTASIGGNFGCDLNSLGCGTVFKLTPDGRFKVLYTFCQSQYCPDGAFPSGALIRDQNGNLYGTAYEGGDENCIQALVIGCGVVFKISANGTETVLHSFTGYPDGNYPYAGLTADKAGNLYGTTVFGGDGEPCPVDYGCGSVFEVAPVGNETMLYGFCQIDSSCPDGAYPQAGVLIGANGNLYGTTYAGGYAGCYQDEGCGVVFKLAPHGTQTVLHTFEAYANGVNPSGGLRKSGAGTLYGTTQYGGTDGTLFEVAR